MSRFGNLEFGSDSNESFKDASPKLKGEEHYTAAALEAFHDGEFESALRLFGRILDHNAQSILAWTGQVRMLIELGEYDEARLWADKALEKFPSDAELLAAKAVALGRVGDLEGAITFSDAAISEKADLPYVWLARGDVLLARKEQRADYCFEKALLLAFKDWVTLWLVARIRFFYGQFSNALKLVQQALELNPGHFLLWLEAGQCQEMLGLRGPAQFSYKQAQELNPACKARQNIAKMSQAGLGVRAFSWWKRLFNSR